MTLDQLEILQQNKKKANKKQHSHCAHNNELHLLRKRNIFTRIKKLKKKKNNSITVVLQRSA